jgi:PAS domain S-box-containing protein
MHLSKTQLIESVFAGGGEMAARMRALDWSTTALGPVEQWPQSLRACLRIVLNSGHPMMIAWGRNYTLLYNDTFPPLLGTKHPWALGRGIREVFPEAWHIAGPLYDKVMMQGQEATLLTDQLIIFNRNNYLEEVYFTWSASPIPDDNGEVGGVLSTALETTERVLEDRRRHLLRDLASRTAGVRNQQEVWCVSAETLGQDRLSLPFVFLYEYRPSEHQAYLAGASVETDEALHPLVIDCHSDNLWRFEPALTRDGIVVELGSRASNVSVPNWPAPPKQASVVPIRLGEHSEALGFLVVGIHPGRAFDDAYRQFVHRITEQITIGLASAHAYEQERQRAEALEEIDRAKTQFFSNVSHEFRTPLTLILGPLDQLLSEARERLSSGQHEQLATIHRNALRLLKLVNTLLDFSRIEAGRVQASYQPTELASFTSDIASIFRSAMDNAGLRYSVECQPVAEPVYVDRDMWEKIVLNLLSNAFKFTFEGEVAVTLKSVDGAVELQVRDTGVGIPEEHRERVFERFHRIESTRARTHEGTGIGLALVRELVKLHGGRVLVESTVGVGSTFTVRIPRGKEHLPAERIRAAESFTPTKIAAEAYAENAQQWFGDESSAVVDVAMLRKATLTTSSSEPKPAAKRELIILADDNADMRRYLTHMLGEQYEVSAVADGHQALEATRKLRPALVLTDVMMPNLDGFGLLRAIREDSTLAGTPVILLSARAGEESRVEGLRADADDYLVKPFTARELLARVATHVKMANLRRETAEREERLRSEAELEHEKLRASEERLVETRRLFRELQNREAKIRRLVEANVVGIVMWNLEGAITGANDAFLRMVGYDREDLATGRLRWTDITPPEWRDQDERAIADLEANGVFQPCEKEYFRKDGSRVPVLIGGALFEDSGNEGVAFILDLSEQKRAEAEIQKSEAKLRQVIDTIPTLAWCNLPDGPNEFLNRRWHEYTGLSPEQSHGWGWQAAFHPEDLPLLMERWMKMLASGESDEIEARLRRHDGVYRWFLIRAEAFRDESGKIVRWYGTSTDIDDRKRAEDELRTRELDARSLLDNVPGFLGRHSPDGTPEIVNRPFLQYQGKTVEEIQKWRTSELVHPDDLAYVIEAFGNGISRGQPWDLEFRLRRFDGIYRWFQARWVPVRDVEGRILHWNALTTDIDDRKRAEAELKRAHLHLAEAQRLSKTGSFVSDLMADEHVWSKEARRICEFDPEAKVTVQMLRDIIHTEDLPAYEAAIARGLTGADVDFVFRIVTSRGVMKHLRGIARVTELVAGRPLFSGAIQDVTEVKEAEEALNRARSELAHVTRVTTLNALTASIAHEVNQPLSGIVSNASASLRFLSGDTPNLEEAREAVRDIVRDGKRAAEIITRIRALTKRTATSREKLDLNETISEVLALISDEAKRQRVIVRTQFDDTLSPAAGDRVQLQQVVLNLVMNAIEAMSSISERPRELVITTQNIDADRVQATVEDSGVGIASDAVDKIFDSFYTTKTAGMGMGLSISRSILQSHGGRLWVEGKDAPGTMFHFTVPKYHEEGAHAPASGT